MHSNTTLKNKIKETQEGFYFPDSEKFITSDTEALTEMKAIINSEPHFYLEINTKTATKEEIQNFLFNENIYYYTSKEI